MSRVSPFSGYAPAVVANDFVFAAGAGPDDKDPKETRKDKRLMAALRYSKRRANNMDIEWPDKKRPRKKPR